MSDLVDSTNGVTITKFTIFINSDTEHPTPSNSKLTLNHKLCKGIRHTLISVLGVDMSCVAWACIMRGIGLEWSKLEVK